ncbi:RecQ family ATP-dependent DNA helicase [Gemmatimonas sp.]|uniref:RecQ family ATP-dependent DNA helicase n=1 Tax=Gemmatimonas sp. TaxID=1962908 RepID=UPI0035667BBE
MHPHTEQELLNTAGLGERIRLSPGDLSPRLEPPLSVAAGQEHLPWPGPTAVTQADLPYDSEEERRFQQEWVPRTLGDEWARWFIPQASLDLLLLASGVDGGGARRVDFLVAAPWCQPFVVEIDGDHGAQAAVDEARDVALRQAGYDVVRVEASELERGGPGLAEVQRRCTLPPTGQEDVVVGLLRAASQVHRLALALLEALAAGFVAGDRWVVQVHDDTEQAVALIEPYLNVLAAASALWGDERLAPALLQLGGSAVRTFELSDGRYVPVESPELPVDVIVHLEANATPVVDLPARDGRIPQVVVRSAVLPVEIRDVAPEGSARVAVVADEAVVRHALGTMLTAVFAKKEFRAGQLEAILEVLSGHDCVVLLPTGAGKSLIYQLAGLCMPGRTLVIDPLVALIEDQVFGLHRDGIDRVCWITSDLVQQHGTDALLDAVESADALFILVSPERLQMERFRTSLTMLSVQTPINLAVVDEAHCVSEWGHQFRTSYLRLGATIRTTCTSGGIDRPPLLALTGTASRAVLRDVLHELEIEERSENTIVRPTTFDRPELHYRVVTTAPAQADAVLQAAVRALPGEFNQQGATFFSSRGEKTASGIVFCQVVNGRRGVVDVAKSLVPVVGTLPVVFAGKEPKGVDRRQWSAIKAHNATQFKANSAPVLVSTNAFGMGINKPNIRWVAHYGLPGSIESFYQEVGRAGRDGDEAHCVLVYTEFDEARARSLLSDDLGLEEARRRCSEITSWSERDDVTSALFFHFNSFPGVEPELAELQATAELLDPGDTPRVREIPFGRDDDARERSLHRLVLLGVVREYLVDWGAQKFTVYLNPVRPEAIGHNLIAFVERSQPGRIDAIREELADSDFRKLSQAISVCGRILILFVYDTIERSRRRSLREMWIAVKESQTDADLRQRVLDYLTEGDLAPLLEGLSEAQRFDFSRWQDAYAQMVSLPDAREWRGTTARLLASYPDQPGLLVGRAVVELVDPDGDLEDFHANLDSALAAAPRYQIGPETLDELYRWLLRMAAGRSERAFAATLAHLSRIDVDARILDEALDGVGVRHATASGVAVVRLQRGLRNEVRKSDEIIELLRGRYL